MHKARWIKSVFTFSKSDIRGIIVLVIIIVALLFIKHRKYKKLDSYDLEVTYSGDSTKLFGTESKVGHPNNDVSQGGYAKRNIQTIDPNSATYHELISVGLPSAVARNLIKFREHGAKFQSPDDLLKVYGFDSLLFMSVKSFFTFIPGRNLPSRHQRANENHLKIELNRSDSIALERLPGIGSVLSARIIKYRNLLGGFYSTEQLREVYGMTDSLLLTLSEYIEVDTTIIYRMHLNTTTLEEFEHHPYLNRYQAKAILSYRRLMGPFTSVDQLVTNYLIPEGTYYQLLPYLQVN